MSAGKIQLVRNGAASPGVLDDSHDAVENVNEVLLLLRTFAFGDECGEKRTHRGNEVIGGLDGLGVCVDVSHGGEAVEADVGGNHKFFDAARLVVHGVL